MRTKYLAAICLFVLLSSFCLSAFGDSYSIDWHKISGGGGTSTGGVYSVTGSIGQSDSGSAMSGGNYSMTGGFWSLISVVQTAGAPTMSVAQSGNVFSVAWSLPSGSWVLQQSTNLALTNGWTTSAYSLATNNGVIGINITNPTGQLFFRLNQ